MATRQETRDEIDAFFSSSAGSVVIAQLEAMREENNNLLRVLNSVRESRHPDMDLARSGGVVEGVDRALLIIDTLRKGEE